MAHVSHILLWLPVAMLIGFVAAWLESRPLRNEPRKPDAAHAGLSFLERRVAALLEERRLLWGQIHILSHRVGRLHRALGLDPEHQDALASAELATFEAAQ